MYRECPPPAPFGALVECGWTAATPAGRRQRVLPDGCMDLVWTDGELLVAGPDTRAFLSDRGAGGTSSGLRFRPGLLKVPAAELRNRRVPLAELRPGPARAALARLDAGADPVGVLLGLGAGLASGAGTRARETAPWSPAALQHVTGRLADGAAVSEVAEALGITTRSLGRHCAAVFGYGPAVLRRVLRFRRAVGLLDGGLAPAEVAARAGYADQPHLSREVRSLAGLSPGQLVPGRPEPDLPGRYRPSGANRSIPLPSGSSTDA